MMPELLARVVDDADFPDPDALVDADRSSRRLGRLRSNAISCPPDDKDF